MFNYIAASLLVYMLVDVLRPQGQMDPATARFPEGTNLPTLDTIPGFNLIFHRGVPANVTLFVALSAAFLVWVLLWRTRLGYEIRAFGKSETAARYAGISAFKITMIAMLISGALAGMMAINNVMGESERLVQNSAEGAGFIGIAVALIGRNHPVGVVLAAMLFGFLYQGGAELGLVDLDPDRVAHRGAGPGDPVHRRAGPDGADVAGLCLPGPPGGGRVMDYCNADPDP